MCYVAVESRSRSWQLDLELVLGCVHSDVCSAGGIVRNEQVTPMDAETSPLSSLKSPL